MCHTFVTAWAGKAPLLPLEIKFLGWKFAVLRIVFIIPFAIILGLLSQFILGKLRQRPESIAKIKKEKIC
ncbi:MAG: hypothetical protein ACUVWN_14325 [bacterium]